MLADMKRLSDVWSSVHNWVWLSLTQLYLLNNGVKVNMLQLSTDSMCKSSFVISGLVITGSWDKTVKTWDPRQPQPTGTYSQPDKVNNPRLY